MNAVSLGTIMDEDKTREVKAPAVSVTEEPLTDERMLEAWHALAEKNAARTRLKIAMESAQVVFRDEEGFRILSFAVSNTAQRDWIQTNLLRTLESDFQALLSSGKARLEVVAAETVVQDRAYTDEEKMKELMASDPEVRNLVIDLNLDI